MRLAQQISTGIINTIHEHFYMNDYLDCFSSEERAVDTTQKVISILSNEWFRLTKWLSNNKSIIKSVPLNQCCPKIFDLGLDNIPVERSLNVIRNPQREMHWIKGVAIKNATLTKGGLLSSIRLIYDPVGLNAPVTEPKLIIKDL